MAMRGVPLVAQEKKEATPAVADTGTTVKCALVGAGVWGREILNTLARFPKADVIAVCDRYESASFQRRTKEAAPKAELYTDYKKVLENKAVQAVLAPRRVISTRRSC
jgi:predicted homoserine dehydrogenase-like protein